MHSRLRTGRDPKKKLTTYFLYLIILGVFCTSIAIILFNYLIQRSSALFASSTTYLIPIFAIIWGAIDFEIIDIKDLIGISIILIGVAVIRELFGSGTLFGYEILPLVSNGGWYMVNNILLLPPSSFIIIGLFIWAIRSYKPAQIEVDVFEIKPHSTVPDLTKREINV